VFLGQQNGMFLFQLMADLGLKMDFIKQPKTPALIGVFIDYNL
jgi:hypothetical protein